MPTPKNKRNYRTEYKATHGTPTGKQQRAARNTARKDAMKAGKVHKGDGKEIDHVKPLSKGGSTAASNTRVTSRAANRRKAASTTVKPKAKTTAKPKAKTTGKK